MRKVFTRIAFLAFVAVAIFDPTCRATVVDAADSFRAMVENSGTQPAPATAADEATPAGTAGSSASYTIARTGADGSPVRWNPCAPVHLVVNTANAPAGAYESVSAAAAQMSAASGLHIVVDGKTSATPSQSYPTRQFAGRHGWAPVLVAWAAPGTGPLANDGSSGVGMPAWVEGPNGAVYVSGQAVLNAKQNDMYLSGYGASRVQALVEHELGHVLGLGHTDDPAQVMHDTVGAVGDLGAGDKAGLAVLGSGGCRTVPVPSWG